MRKEIKSPAIKTSVPYTPVINIDSYCAVNSGLFVDKQGNTYDCDETLSMWTDGISYGNIYIGRSFLNTPNSTVCFTYKKASKALIYPVIFGNRSSNGFWLEIQRNNYRWRNNSGTILLGEICDKHHFGIVRIGTEVKFYIDGLLLLSRNLSINTENSTQLSIPDGDKINHFISYEQSLTEQEMYGLYLENAGRTKGLDRLGYMNTIQSFSIE